MPLSVVSSDHFDARQRTTLATAMRCTPPDARKHFLRACDRKMSGEPGRIGESVVQSGIRVTIRIDSRLEQTPLCAKGRIRCGLDNPTPDLCGYMEEDLLQGE
jgi:hypothetical protein